MENTTKNNKTINTINDLLNALNRYPKDTLICSGYTTINSMVHTDLVIKESHPLGDRDAEETLLLWIGSYEEH